MCVVQLWFAETVVCTVKHTQQLLYHKRRPWIPSTSHVMLHTGTFLQSPHEWRRKKIAVAKETLHSDNYYCNYLCTPHL